MNVVWEWIVDIVGAWIIAGVGLWALYEWQDWEVSDGLGALIGFPVFLIVLFVVRRLRARATSKPGSSTVPDPRVDLDRCFFHITHHHPRVDDAC